MQRVPADRRAAMERHIAHLAETGLAQNAKGVGDSLHAPEVECIGKGKAHKPYEFGVKVSA